MSEGEAEAPRARWAAAVRLLFMGASAAALAVTLLRADLGRAVSIVAAVGAPVLLALVPHLVAMSCQTVTYFRLVSIVWTEPRGLAPVSFPRLLSVMLSSEAILMAFPGGAAIAESVSPYLAKRRCGVPLPEGLAAVASKKALIVLANGLYLGLAAAIGWPHMRRASIALVGSPGLEWLVVGAAIAIVIAAIGMIRALVSGSLAARSHGLLSRVPSAWLRRQLDDGKEGFLETDRKFGVLFGAKAGRLAGATAWVLACWIVEGSETWIILRLLGLDLSLAAVLSFEVVVGLARSLAFMVPAGLGVQDAGYVAFLGALGVPDAATVGVAFLLIKRSKEIAWIALGFLMFLIVKETAPPARRAMMDT